MVAGKASATSPSMLTRTRLGVIDGQGDTRRGERPRRPAASDWMAQAPPIGDGEVSATSASEPPRIHSGDDQAAGSAVGHVEHPGDTGNIDAAEFECARKDFLHLRVGHGGVRVDERQRHLAVQRGVQCLPELQVRRTAVEHQQSVAAFGDGRPGDEVHVVFGRFQGGIVRRRERDRLARRVTAVIGERARRPVGPRSRPSRRTRRPRPTGAAAAGSVKGDVRLELVGGRTRQLVVSVVIPELDVPELDAEFSAGPSAASSVTGDPFHIPAPATPAGVPPPAAAGLDGHPVGEEFL